MEPLVKTNQIMDIMPPVVIPQMIHQVITIPAPLLNVNASSSPIAKPIQSTNFKMSKNGWQTDSNGNVQLNGSKVVSTHFTPVFSSKGLTIYISDGTTPNGNLSGNAGDVCFGADAGKAYKCTLTTTWLSFT